MHRIILVSATMIGLLAGCATQPPLSSAEIVRLQGGTTTVVVYGFCVPMDHLIKTTMYRYTLDFLVDGKKVGSMQSCSHQTFRVKSGYWSTAFQPQTLMGWPQTLPDQIYRPGATQYLHMSPAGNYQFSGAWVSQSDAKSGIEEIRRIGQVF